MIRYTYNTNLFAALLAILFLSAGWSQAAVLTTDTVWKGEVVLTEDVLVPQGVTLTIAPGTVIRANCAESTKTDPEYLSPLVELTIRGTLRADGGVETPILFTSSGDRKAGAWAGIIIDGGSTFLKSCRVRDAETAVSLVSGRLRVDGTTLSGNRYGMAIQGREVDVRGKGNLVTGNDYGLVISRGASPPSGLADVNGNLKKDILAVLMGGWNPGAEPPQKERKLLSRRYGDEVLKGETVWREKVMIDGIVRVPEGSRLVIMPGTVVVFGTRDTNGDGLGENGLLVQGVIIAKGTPAEPIVFCSADKKVVPGGWDAINILNSSGAWNLVENCRIEDAYRGLHFHFSRVAVTDSVLRNCYRGMQFQESNVLARGNRFYNNRSAVQGRDSEVSFNSNRVYGNYQGINFLRVRLVARNNLIASNYREGIRIREGATLLEENLIDGNRYGLLAMDAFYGGISRNSISNNGEIGFSLKNCDNLDISGNFIAGNGLNGMNIQQTGGRISGNLISDNGERGMAIQSFSGLVEGNDLAANGLYAIDLDGPADVAAPRNWWGGDSPDRAIFDKGDDPAMGRVSHGEESPDPLPFRWPLAGMVTDHTLRGEISIGGTLRVSHGATLTIAPGTRVNFDENAGLMVTGRIIATGGQKNRIVFTSGSKREGSWNEIILEHADGSIFSNCLFEYATWGLHSHFTRLLIDGTVFRKNRGGFRFRSGPVEIKNSCFMDNSIGIRSFRGNASIHDNEITGNETGIFVREKGGGLSIHGNNIFDNSDYNMRIGDFNNEDVDATRNWWGNGDPKAAIFDGRNEPGIGMVLFEPYLKGPVKMERGVSK